VGIGGIGGALDEAQHGEGEGGARQMAKAKGARIGMCEGAWVKVVSVAMVALRGHWGHAH
jgi:hypothetical protein